MKNRYMDYLEGDDR